MSGHPVGVAAGRLVPPARYRHPGDVIRLIAGSAVLGCSVAASAAARRWLLGPAAPVTDGLGSGPASVLTGLVQVAFMAAAALVVAAALRRRRFRLLGGLAVAAAVAAGIVAGIIWLLGGPDPDALTDNLARGSWLASAAFPGPAVIACAVAVIVAASPWMSRPWRRAAWLALLLAAAARIVTGTVLPMELIIAIAAGVMVGAGVLVAFGVPDQRMGAGEIAAALRSAGLPVETVRAAERSPRLKPGCGVYRLHSRGLPSGAPASRSGSASPRRWRVATSRDDGHGQDPAPRPPLSSGCSSGTAARPRPGWHRRQDAMAAPCRSCTRGRQPDQEAMMTTVNSQHQPNLTSQTVVVIGGGAGIVLQTARRAHAEAAGMVLTGRSPRRLERAAADLPEPSDRVMVTAAGPAFR